VISGVNTLSAGRRQRRIDFFRNRSVVRVYPNGQNRRIDIPASVLVRRTIPAVDRSTFCQVEGDTQVVRDSHVDTVQGNWSNQVSREHRDAGYRSYYRWSPIR
jgi:hypothetical protein